MEEDPLSEPPLEGGPNVAELPEDFVDSKRLIEELKHKYQTFKYSKEETSR